MGCNCEPEKKHNGVNDNKNRIIINRALTKDKNKNKTNNDTNKKGEDKISTLSSFISENSINTLEKTGNKIKTRNLKFYTNKKNVIDSLEDSLKNSIPPTPHTFQDLKNKYENNGISNREYLCTVSKFDINNNNNSKEKKKYTFKQGQITPLYNLVNLIKNSSENKDINKKIFLFYKGNRIHDNDTIYNIINKKQNQFENLFNNSISKQKETNEINFDMISISEDEEENVNDDSFNKKKLNSFSSNESENEKIKKPKIDKIKKKNNDKEKYLSSKLMYKLSSLCKNHQQENLIYICLTCFNSFCPLDFKEHKKEFKEHEIIPKSKLIELNYDIKTIKLNLNDKFKEITSDINNGGGYIQTFGENENDENKLNYISSNDIFSKLKIGINDINEEMENLYNSYKQSYNKFNSKFISIYEEKMPKIIEFDEYIDKTIMNYENINTFSNESIFIDNYNNFLNIKKNSNKFYQDIISLKDIILKYKEFLELFKDKGKELIEYIKKGIENIMRFKNDEKMFNVNGAFLQLNEKDDIMNNNNNLNNNNKAKNNIFKSVNNISINTNKDKKQVINLKFLFSEKKGKLSKSLFTRNIIMNNYNNNNNTNISNGCSSAIKSKNKNCINNYNSLLESIKDKDKLSNIMKDKISSKNEIIKKDNKQFNKNEEKYEKELKSNEIELKSPSILSSKGFSNDEINSPSKQSLNIIPNKDNDKNIIQNCIYSLLYGTKNIIQYLAKTQKLNIISPDISFLKIKKFESYISSINYKNIFYISGGYSTSKQFFEYNVDSNQFIKLPEMLSNHYYHTMIGNKNYIYSVSGFKSKKIEKYDILNKKWESLPDLTYERASSNVFFYNDNIFVYGKINNSNDEENSNIIEYYNIEKDNYNYNENKWNQIKLKVKCPFNSGIIICDNNNILLVGGKMDFNENSTDTCYNLTINNKDNKFKINIELSDIKLEKPDEFNGNIFSCLDEDGLNYGLFSCLNPYSLYIYHKDTNKFTCINYDSCNKNSK